MTRQVACVDTTQGTGGEGKGKFFIVDSRIWARVAACGMNEAAACRHGMGWSVD